MHSRKGNHEGNVGIVIEATTCFFKLISGQKTLRTQNYCLLRSFTLTIIINDLCCLIYIGYN